jgi:ATP-binding cassette subfamily C (CFTR/MRP) protein 4
MTASLKNTNNQTLVQTAEKKVSQKQKEAKETRASGKVSKQVYSSYVKASGSYFVALIVLAIFILTEIFATGADYFISFW